MGKNFAVLDIFLWDIHRDHTLHNFFSNIKIDIWHPAVDLRSIIPPLGGINALQVHSRVSNINFDIWKKIVEGVVSMNIP
jgi:hypothetical protein